MAFRITVKRDVPNPDKFKSRVSVESFTMANREAISEVVQGLLLEDKIVSVEIETLQRSHKAD